MDNTTDNSKLSINDITSDKKALSVFAASLILVSMILPVNTVRITQGFILSREVTSFDSVGWDLLGAISLIPMSMFAISSASMIYDKLRKYSDISAQLSFLTWIMFPVAYFIQFKDVIRFYLSWSNADRDSLFGGLQLIDIVFFFAKSLVSYGNLSLIAAVLILFRSWRIDRKIR